jgi:hypothetical protein
MYGPLLTELLTDAHVAESRRLGATAACDRIARAPSVRARVACLLVKAGMWVHHRAGERAASHVHAS